MFDSYWYHTSVLRYIVCPSRNLLPLEHMGFDLYNSPSLLWVYHHRIRQEGVRLSLQYYLKCNIRANYFCTVCKLYIRTDYNAYKVMSTYLYNNLLRWPSYFHLRNNHFCNYYYHIVGLMHTHYRCRNHHPLHYMY